MIVKSLAPSLDLLSQEYVLVHAWKKTAAYIRRHNWYADTLELDRATVNLPRFLEDLRAGLTAMEGWTTKPLRMVPAPKSQRWLLDKGGDWRPEGKGKTNAKLRPLAHVALADQVAATAILLCLADTVESLQGDPKGPTSDTAVRRRVVSYGNRLFSDEIDGRLRHRWGSGRLYGEYFADYRTFLERPALVCKAAQPRDGCRAVVVHSDLKQFYDRVRPGLLAAKIRAVVGPDVDERFLRLSTQVLDWTWHAGDQRDVSAYAEKAGIVGFDSVALPQGLVAAGFFANVVLLDFDKAVRESFDQEVSPGMVLVDACRYVDDLRFVFQVRDDLSLKDAEVLSVSWLRGLLDRHAPALEPSPDKTRAALVDGDDRPLVRQGKSMQRIQKAISGGFDAAGGEEILNAVQGLMRAQERYSEQQAKEKNWALAPVADVGDATVARFAAARYRRTYRSLRPLLSSMPGEGPGFAGVHDNEFGRVLKTQQDLDDDVRAFALGLIENWIDDPSKVRLLRIGLDLWPDPKVLQSVFGLLFPFIEKDGKRGAPRRIACYCMAEVLRAGATETGIVEDDESLPSGVNLAGYRELLAEKAVAVLGLPTASAPWYLKQQALLFLAAYKPEAAPFERSGRSQETGHYRRLVLFLRGAAPNTTNDEYATMAALARRSFLDAERTIELVSTGVDARKLEEIAARDPSFAAELAKKKPELVAEIAPRVRDDLCLRSDDITDGLLDGWNSLARVVLDGGREGVLRSEPAILDLLTRLLDKWPSTAGGACITPNEVQVRHGPRVDGETPIEGVRFVPSRLAGLGSIYAPPLWCPGEERWRFQLGYILRFILAASEDFTKRVRPPSWRETRLVYRPPTSHWMQRRYGLYSGQSEFGDEWLPISDWLEHLLYALLRWPGCPKPKGFDWIERGLGDARAEIHKRLTYLLGLRGRNGLWLVPVLAPDPASRPVQRPLRACIVQTVIPRPEELGADPTQSALSSRWRHRNHISAALAAVERMLQLRETHLDLDRRLDWLILPELSVHPRDVHTHLVPFARAHRAVVLAGLTFDELFLGQPYVNSAIWVIPTKSPDGGLEVITRRQGKWNLSPLEQRLNLPTPRVQGFRPCQWLVGYEWSPRSEDRPLWLTAAVCYDATDLGLAAALKGHSDVFAIPALNQDVGTFDQMAASLHYHMFQYVVVVNNGQFGGSNAYAPYRDRLKRQVFHLHGQPQASIAFFEIDDIRSYLVRNEDARAETGEPRWKFPPAGLDGEDA